MVVTHRVGAAAALVFSLASNVVAVPDAAHGLDQNEVSQPDLGESITGPDIDCKLDDRDCVDELGERDFELYVRDNLLAPRAISDGLFPFNGPGRRGSPRRGRGAPRGSGTSRGRGTARGRGTSQGCGTSRGCGPSRGRGARECCGRGRGNGFGEFGGMHKAGPPESGHFGEADGHPKADGPLKAGGPLPPDDD